MTRVIIVAAGGHAKVIADALLLAARSGSPLVPIGFVDENPALMGATILGLPVFGPTALLSSIPHEGVVVAIGDNRRRRDVVAQLHAWGESFIIARHPAATVAADVVLGAGAMLCAGAIVNTATAIGAHAILNTGCSIDHDCTIGDFVHIAPGSHLGGDVSVGAASLVGIGATVLPGVRIGAGCIVGAGAVVRHAVPDGAKVFGVPARLAPSAQKSGQTLR